MLAVNRHLANHLHRNHENRDKTHQVREQRYDRQERQQLAERAARASMLPRPRTRPSLTALIFCPRD